MNFSETEMTQEAKVTANLFKTALLLAGITITYNILEGLISVFFGFDDESFTLLGFGVDSFIEVLSGIGIAHMILRIRNKPNSDRDTFEQTALRITGIAFYILVAGLVVSSLYNIWSGHRPETSLAGLLISLLSLLTMFALMTAKRRVGNALNSQAILADAECTKVCIYMSLILLGASGLYMLTHIPYLDSLGTLGLSYFAFKEGKECFEKSRNQAHCCKI